MAACTQTLHPASVATGFALGAGFVVAALLVAFLVLVALNDRQFMNRSKSR